MNFISKITNFFRKKSYWTSISSLLFKDEPERPTNKDYLDSYKMSFLVYACIRKIAEKVANTDFILYKVGNKKIDEVEDHPILDLLAQVNPYTTKFEMLDMTQTFLELLGNAYWLKVRGNNGGKPLELWMLRPDWVKIVPGTDTPVDHYEYQEESGPRTSFRAEDVIQFKQPNPKSSIYGMPTVQPAMETIRNLVYSTRWNMKFFYNSARPDFFVISKKGMDTESKVELRRQWDIEHGGIDNAHKFAILNGEIEVKEMNQTMKEMEFSKLHTESVNDILAAFGVPRAVIGMVGMNRAEAEAQIYTFLAETIEPKIRRIVERLNEFLVPEFGDNLFLDFKDPTPENRKADLEFYASALSNHWMVINEVRDKENLPPLKGGWDIYMPITMTPVGGIKEGGKSINGSMIKIGGIDKETYYKDKEERRQRELREKVMNGKRKLKLKQRLKGAFLEYYQKKREFIKNNFTPDKKNVLWNEHDKLMKADEKMFAAVTRALFRKQEERMIEALRSEFTGKSIIKGKYDIVNWNIEKRIFVEVALPVFSDVVTRRGKRAAKLVGMGEFVVNDAVKRYIDKKTFRFAEYVNDTTRDQVRDALKAGIEAGEGVNELEKRIHNVFVNRRKYETERIARTEILESHNRADLLAYDQSGVVEAKEWLAEPDACEICRDIESRGEKKLHDDFSSKLISEPVQTPPAHPNCRCAILPVIEGSKQLKTKRSERKKVEDEKSEKIDKEKIEKEIKEKVERDLRGTIKEILSD